MTRLLIVNADDFGLTPAVSRGILRAHRDGIVTSVSALAVAPAFAESASELRGRPELGVGVHLALVGEDPPLLAPSRISSLVDGKGRFPLEWKRFLLRGGRLRPEEIEAELSAQIERVRDAGLPIDHLDAHQHLHLLPPVRSVLLRLARRFDVPAIRVPHAGGRRAAGFVVRWFARRLERSAAAEGLLHPELSQGFDDAGRTTRERLLRVLARLAASRAASAEILVHPGERHDPERARYAWGYDWGGELEALVDPDVRAAVARSGWRLGTYRDLAGRHG